MNKTASSQIDLRGFWVRLWKLLAPSQKQISRILVMICGIELLRLLGPFLLKIVIDKVNGFDASQINYIVGLIGLVFLVNQSVSLFNYFIDRKIFDLLAGTMAYLSNNAHEKMVHLGLSYHEKENTGSKVIKINRGIDKIEGLFANFFWEVGPTIFQIVLTTITLFVVDWRFGWIILIFVPIFVYLTLKVNAMVFPFRLKRFDYQELAAGLMTQSIININTVKSFTQELREYKQFSRATENVRSSVLEEFRRILQFNIARNLIIDLGRGLVLLAGVYMVLHGSISVGSLVFVYTVSEKALISLFRISRLYDRIMESSEAVDRLYYLSLEESDIKNPVNGHKPNTISGEIEFQKVSFRYTDSKTKALDRVSFKIKSGCVTALVGPSGGGKTTVARMVYRHYDPIDGRVLLDGKNLSDYDLYSFRKFMAIVPQEVEIFNASVKENISYARPKASRQEIVAAAKIANADEFIDQLKNGYDTLVGERGIKLSGGQRQRVGIARAILANPRILIFDEATSSLDSYSEKLIQEAMDKISKNRTVIIIAHRLSTIKKADKIVVLEKGKVVEEGSHFELSKVDGGLYQKLINLQELGDVE